MQQWMLLICCPILDIAFIGSPTQHEVVILWLHIPGHLVENSSKHRSLNYLVHSPTHSCYFKCCAVLSSAEQCWDTTETMLRLLKMFLKKWQLLEIDISVFILSSAETLLRIWWIRLRSETGPKYVPKYTKYNSLI